MTITLLELSTAGDVYYGPGRSEASIDSGESQGRSVDLKKRDLTANTEGMPVSFTTDQETAREAVADPGKKSAYTDFGKEQGHHS